MNAVFLAPEFAALGRDPAAFEPFLDWIEERGGCELEEMVDHVARLWVCLSTFAKWIERNGYNWKKKGDKDWPSASFVEDILNRRQLRGLRTVPHDWRRRAVLQLFRKKGERLVRTGNGYIYVPGFNQNTLRQPADVYNDLPLPLSGRYRVWLERFKRGWKPNKKVRSLNREDAAAWYGISVWEYRKLRGEMK